MSDIDKARALAARLGLTRLTDAHLEQLARATTGMQRHLDRLPRDLSLSAEAAHVYRAKPADR